MSSSRLSIGTPAVPYPINSLRFNLFSGVKDEATSLSTILISLAENDTNDQRHDSYSHDDLEGHGS